MHALPPVPHVACEGVSHVLPLQQPVVHVTEHPAQALFTHAPPVPQSTQADPLPPHAPACVPGWQTPFTSQQPAQFVPLHTHWPLTQERLFEHAGLFPHMQCPPVHESAVVRSQIAHALPPLPHVARVACSQAVPLQHPLGHEVAVHWHEPLRHCWPAGHAGPPPHVHVPCEQVSVALGSHATQLAPPPPQAPVELPV